MTTQALSPQPLSPNHQIYADLMDEARIRIHAIRDIIHARDSWTPRLLQEFVYLQLRALCETIALGCLVAHGDVKSRSTLKEWKIPAIMKEMEKLNPDFVSGAIAQLLIKDRYAVLAKTALDKAKEVLRAV